MAASTLFDRRWLISVQMPSTNSVGVLIPKGDMTATVSFLRPMFGKLNNNAVPSGMAGVTRRVRAQDGFDTQPFERVQPVPRRPPANPRRALNKNG
jgi:hypothetical protein